MYLFENRYNMFIDKLNLLENEKNHVCFIGHDYGLSDFAMYLKENNERIKVGEIIQHTI